MFDVLINVRQIFRRLDSSHRLSFVKGIKFYTRQFSRVGAHFVATNPDRTCPVEGGEIPDCAGMIAAIEAVTGKKVEIIVGKPSPIMIQAALEVMGLKPEDCILIGDRLETDIKMGRDSGIATGIVLTGVTDEKTLKETSIPPDFVFQTITDVENLLIGR